MIAGRGVGAAAFAALLLAGQPAWAATISARQGTTGLGPGGGLPLLILEYRSAPGEQNDVVISHPDGTSLFTIVDSGAPLTATDRCVQEDQHTATCTGSGAPQLSISAGDGDDRLRSDQGGFILLGEGDDDYEGTGGTLDAGPGNDRVTSGGSLAGGEGNDILRGGGVQDFIYAGPGLDEVTGGDGDDQIYDESAELTADRFDGGPGRDRLDYGAHTQAVRVDLAAQGTAGSAGENDTIASIEDLAGSQAADELMGSDGDNEITGKGGGDRIDGRGGSDRIAALSFAPPTNPSAAGVGGRIVGGEGDDLLLSTIGDDELDGGPGVDTLSYGVHGAAVSVDLADDHAGEEGERDAIAGFENLTGGLGPDSLRGNADPNLIDGGGGRDRIDGLGGDDLLRGGHEQGPGDRIRGGAGDDVVAGQSGRDRALGESGNDRLYGGEDDTGKVDLGTEPDRLIGGSGADVLISRTRTSGEDADRLSCGNGRDVAETDADDTVRLDCERLRSRRGLEILPRPKAITGDALIFRMRCPAGGRRCRGRLRLESLPVPGVGKARFRIPVGHGALVRVPLRRAVRERLRQRRLLVFLGVRSKGNRLEAAFFLPRSP